MRRIVRGGCRRDLRGVKKPLQRCAPVGRSGHTSQWQRHGRRGCRGRTALSHRKRCIPHCGIGDAAAQQKSGIWKKCISQYRISAQVIVFIGFTHVSYIRHK
jgi:hypothetical protein